MSRLVFQLVTVASLALLQGCCLIGKKDEATHTDHQLVECGLAVKLPSHFGKPTHGSGCSYEWTANEGETTMRVQSALPGDHGQETEAKTAGPTQKVDFARETKFGGLPAKERRTQEDLGAKRRIVWTAFIEGPKGAVNLKVIMVQTETPDEFGQSFWDNLRKRWIQPL